jgi:hypothetical protein
MPFAAAGAIAAGVGAAAGLAGSAMQAGAVRDAASSAQNALSKGLRTAQGDLEPYRETGDFGRYQTGALQGQYGPEAQAGAFDAFRTSPGYGFQLDQGLRAVDAGAAAQGMLRSGATLKAEQTFGQGLADQEFTNYYNRLFALSGQGLTASDTVARAATGVGGNAAQVELGQGNAMSSIYANTAKGIGTTANQLLTPQNMQAAQNALFPGGTQYYGNNTNILNSGTIGDPYSVGVGGQSWL